MHSAASMSVKWNHGEQTAASRRVEGESRERANCYSGNLVINCFTLNSQPPEATEAAVRGVNNHVPPLDSRD